MEWGEKSFVEITSKTQDFTNRVWSTTMDTFLKPEMTAIAEGVHFRHNQHVGLLNPFNRRKKHSSQLDDDGVELIHMVPPLLPYLPSKTKFSKLPKKTTL